MSRVVLAFILVVSVLCGACKHNAETEVEKPCVAPQTVSFSQHIQPIFTTQCAISGCHSGSAPEGNLNLEASVAYAQLMKPGKGYIDTINPSFSLLYAQMNSVSNPMPQSGKLDQCTVDLVLAWITQKAKNN
jgi:hypothetical protein